MRLLPANTLLYAEITDAPALIQEIDQFIQEVSRASGKDLKAEFNRELREQGMEDLVQALAQIRSVHLSVVDFTVPVLEGGLERLLLRGQEIEAWLPSMVVLVDFGPRGKIVELFERRFLPQLEAQLPPEFRLFRTEFRGRTFYELEARLEAQQLSLFGTFFRGYLLLSPQRRLLEELLDDSRKRKNSLDNDPLFVNARPHRPQRGALAYLNLTPMWPKLDGLLSLIPGQEGQSVRRMLEEIRPQDLKTLTLAVDLSGDVIKLTSHLQIDPDNPLTAIFRQSPRDLHKLLRLTPQGVSHAAFFAIDDPLRTWQEATSLALRLERITGESNLREALAEARRELRQIGIDLERDLVAYIGQSPAILIWPEGLGLLLRQENVSGTRSHLRNLERNLEKSLQRQGFHFREKRLENLTVRFLEERGRPDLAYTIWDDYLLIREPEGFEDVVQNLVRGKNLGKDPSINSVLRSLPPRSNSIILTNLTSGLPDSSPVYLALAEVWESSHISTYAAVSRKSLVALASTEAVKYDAGGVDAEVKSVLRNAATAQEAFFVDHNRYTTRVDDLITKGLRLPPGVTLHIDRADVRGFMLTARKPGGTVSSWSFDNRTGMLTPGRPVQSGALR
jgi:hypothetical protein